MYSVRIIQQCFYALIFFISILLIIPSISFAEFSENLSQGIKDYNDESYEEAIHFLSVARTEDSSNSDAAYYLGLAYKELGDLTEASKNLNDAVTLGTTKSDVHYHLAQTYLNLNKTTKALSSLDNITDPDGNADFLRAMVLKKQGVNREALILFEDAINKDSSLTQVANYQIGQIHLRQRRYKEAKEVFTDVASLDPNSDMAAFAKRFIDKMEEAKDKPAKPFNFKVGFRAEYDSNIVLKPSDTSVGSTITGSDGHKQTATASGSYRFGDGSGWQTKVGYAFYGTHHSPRDITLSNTNTPNLSDYNFDSHTATLSPAFAGEKTFTSFNLIYNYTNVDGEKYVDSATFNPVVNYLPNKNFMISVKAKAFKKEFAEKPTKAEDDRNSSGGSAGIHFYKFFKDRTAFINLGYDYIAEDTDGDTWDHTINHGVASFVLPIFSGKPKLSAYIDGQEKVFDNEQVLVVGSTKKEIREDRQYTSSVSYSYSINKHSDFVLQYTRTRNDSNSHIYDYDKFVTSVGMDYRF